MERRLLDFMPFDRYSDGQWWHSTGYEVNFDFKDEGNTWYMEFENSDGEIYYFN